MIVVGVHLPQLTVDLEELREHIVRTVPTFSSGRMLENFRDDAAEEFVVDLDAALLLNGFWNSFSMNLAFASLPPASRANATIGVGSG